MQEEIDKLNNTLKEARESMAKMRQELEAAELAKKMMRDQLNSQALKLAEYMKQNELLKQEIDDLKAKLKQLNELLEKEKLIVQGLRAEMARSPSINSQGSLLTKAKRTCERQTMTDRIPPPESQIESPGKSSNDSPTRRKREVKKEDPIEEIKFERQDSI